MFSKYGWIRPLKDKKGETVTEALKSTFKEGRKPQYLWTDKGKEYCNKHLKEFLDKHKKTLYSTENEEKSSAVERWNRTMKNKMWKMFTANNNTVYWDKLDDLVNKYNTTKHSSTRMTPAEATNKKNQAAVYLNLYGNLKPLATKPKYNKKEEIFVIDKVLNKNPVTYKIKDSNNEEIKGSFYEPELLKAE